MGKDLDGWLLRARARDESDPKVRERSESIAHIGLQKLSAALDNPPPKGMNYYDAMRFEFPSFGIRISDVRQAENLYPRFA